MIYKTLVAYYANVFVNIFLFSLQAQPKGDLRIFTQSEDDPILIILIHCYNLQFCSLKPSLKFIKNITGFPLSTKLTGHCIIVHSKKLAVFKVKRRM